jgi:hypothetical protein
MAEAQALAVNKVTFRNQNIYNPVINQANQKPPV